MARDIGPPSILTLLTLSHLLNSRGFNLQALLQTFQLSILIEWTSFTTQSQLLRLQHLQGPQQCGRQLAHSFECEHLFWALIQLILERTPMGWDFPDQDYPHLTSTDVDLGLSETQLSSQYILFPSESTVLRLVLPIHVLIFSTCSHLRKFICYF